MTINCKGKLIDLNVPRVMGIVNVTPDSFFDGGKYQQEKQLLSRIEEIIRQGVDFIDIGGYSSKPNAEFVTESEEQARIVPAIRLIERHFPNVLISVDTFRSSVARACVDEGAAMINDISAGHLDNNMMETVADLKIPYIMMHMRGTPQTMKTLTSYDNIVKEMLFYFSERIAMARSFGINDLILDPGFGFAKTMEQNYEVLQKSDLFHIGLPVLVGISRKSMVYKSLETNAEGSLNGTTILNTIALCKGAKILRVHDVKEAVEAVKLFKLAMKPLIPI